MPKDLPPEEALGSLAIEEQRCGLTLGGIVGIGASYTKERGEWRPLSVQLQ